MPVDFVDTGYHFRNDCYRDQLIDTLEDSTSLRVSADADKRQDFVPTAIRCGRQTRTVLCAA